MPTSNFEYTAIYVQNVLMKKKKEKKSEEERRIDEKLGKSEGGVER